MKSALALMAIVAMIVAIDAPVTGTKAEAASPQCVASCNSWCAKNFAMKNPAACSQQCQLKHCK
jgi:hypothetical protein